MAVKPALGLDLSPLRTSRQFRLLWTGQAVSMLGSAVTLVTAPYQVYRLTRSTLAVALLGLTTLIPIVLSALVGGVLADARDRRRLFLASEAGSSVVVALLAVNAALAQPRVWVVFVLAALAAGLAGVGRPSFEAMVPRVVEPDQVAAATALTVVYGTASFLVGPLVAGLLLATVGPSGAYAVDAATFAVSLAALAAMAAVPPPVDAPPLRVRAIADGLRHVGRDQVLLGTYLLDLTGMVFGLPRALFPALVAHRFGGGPRLLGLLYAAPFFGAFVVNITGRWAARVRRQGLAIVVGVASWGGAIVVFGLTHSRGVAVAALVVAGGADMVSGLFRMIIWRTVIPDELRGRLAGVTVVVVEAGEPLGDLEAGLVASWRGVGFSAVAGGAACAAAALALAVLLPEFVAYRAATTESVSGGARTGAGGEGVAPDPPSPPL